jgi:hypothetical protein
MKRFVEGLDRGQSTLFPECLEDRMDNPVRVIDVFVDQLDLGELGFSGVDPERTGRTSYRPLGAVEALYLRLSISTAISTGFSQAVGSSVTRAQL